MRTRRQLDANLQRENLGVIGTMREQTTGARFSLHEIGTKRVAVNRIAEWCDKQAGDWRVLSLSTPATVLGDLTQSRVSIHDGQEGNVQSPERQLLGFIGRTDLLDNSFHYSAADGQHPKRRARREAA